MCLFWAVVFPPCCICNAHPRTMPPWYSARQSTWSFATLISNPDEAGGRPMMWVFYHRGNRERTHFGYSRVPGQTLSRQLFDMTHEK